MKRIDSYPDLTGYIFKRDNVHWKIIGLPLEPLKSSCASDWLYPVVKSTKTGKEFQSRNSFCVKFVLKQFEAGKMWKATSNNDVSTENLQTAINKRRIRHLEEKIREYQAELEVLYKTL